MDDRIFLNEYRVPTTKSVRWWEGQRIHFTCEAEALQSGEKVTLDVVPLFSLGKEERAERERVAAALRRLRHPGIPMVHAAGVENGRLAVVTETITGLSAKEWIENFGTLSAGEALGIGIQVASAWEATARHGIPSITIHPGNLTIVAGETTEEGWPLVKLPRPFDPAVTLADVDRGGSVSSEIAAFASPERIAGAPMDFRSRVYSLGATLWFLISGEAPLLLTLQPIEGSSSVPNSPAALPGMPRSVNRLLAGLLSERRDQRPLDPVVLERALRNCVSEISSDESMEPIESISPALLAPVVSTANRRFSRRLGVRLLATASAAAILALVLSAWSASESAPHPRLVSEATADALADNNPRDDFSFPEANAPEIPTTVELHPSGLERANVRFTNLATLAPRPHRLTEAERPEAEEANLGKWEEPAPGVEIGRDAGFGVAGAAALKRRR